MFVHSTELYQADFTESPEVLDTVDMVMPICKFIFAVLDVGGKHYRGLYDSIFLHKEQR